LAHWRTTRALLAGALLVGADGGKLPWFGPPRPIRFTWN